MREDDEMRSPNAPALGPIAKPVLASELTPSGAGPLPAMDVWLRFADDEEAEAEANTYKRNGGFEVEWSLTAVGLVKCSPRFDTYEQARAWLTNEGFQDFTA